MNPLPDIQIETTAFTWTKTAGLQADSLVLSNFSDNSDLHILYPDEEAGKEPSYHVALSFGGSHANVNKQYTMSKDENRAELISLIRGLNSLPEGDGSVYAMLADSTLPAVGLTAQKWVLTYTGHFWVRDTSGTSPSYFLITPTANITIAQTSIQTMLDLTS